MRRLLILNLLLLSIVVILMIQIFALWLRAEAEIALVEPRDAKSPRLEVPSVARRPAPPELASSIAEKDLFDQSRTAEQVAVATTSTAPPPPLTLTLLGVTVAGGAREALLKDQMQPKPLWVREGEELGGYKITRIDPAAVVMTAPGGDDVTLLINVEKGKGAAAPALGPAGVQAPTPTAAPGRRGHVAGQSPVPTRTPRAPASDIKEKIERLREEARTRRGQQPKQ